MELLNTICFISATLFVGVLLVLAIYLFFISVYACFQKKMAGGLPAKIAVAFAFACVCPWLFRLMVWFLMKAMGM